MPDAGEGDRLAANLELYNGLLAAGLIRGRVQGTPGLAFQIKVFFLGCVIVDAITVNRRMPFVQALPAAIALILLTLA